MEAFDTNVVVRMMVRDDLDQTRRAELAWRTAVAGGGVFLSVVVLVEFAWVLRVAYKFDRSAVVGALRTLLDTEGVTIEQEPAIRGALSEYEAGAGDFADYVILVLARQAHALPVRTFDERFARHPDTALVP